MSPLLWSMAAVLLWFALVVAAGVWLDIGVDDD